MQHMKPSGGSWIYTILSLESSVASSTRIFSPQTCFYRFLEASQEETSLCTVQLQQKWIGDVQTD